jgi:hypothetical protein
VGLLLVDPGQREADVDEHPVPGLDGRCGLVDERDAHRAAHARDVDRRESRLTVGDVDDPAGDA